MVDRAIIKTGTRMITDSVCSSIYSRTSMAQTPMARFPRLFRTRSRVPRKKPIAADIIKFGII